MFSQHNTTAGNFDHNNFPQRYPTGPQQAMPFPPVIIINTNILSDRGLIEFVLMLP